MDLLIWISGDSIRHERQFNGSPNPSPCTDPRCCHIHRNRSHDVSEEELLIYYTCNCSLVIESRRLSYFIFV